MKGCLQEAHRATRSLISTLTSVCVKLTDAKEETAGRMDGWMNRQQTLRIRDLERFLFLEVCCIHFLLGEAADPVSNAKR